MKAKEKAKDIAYSSIKEKIMNNVIQQGELLSENALAKDLDLSRTPIREAIFKLEAEGFVRTVPNKGCEVVKFDMKDIVDFMQVREGLEGIAARIAAQKPQRRGLFLEMLDELEAIEELESEDNKKKSILVGRDLHKLILETANNQKLIQIVDNLNSQLDRIMILSRYGHQRIQTSHSEHLKIVKAIIDGEQDLAEKSIRNHIIGAANDAILVFQQSYR